jgi:leishmanolysin
MKKLTSILFVGLLAVTDALEHKCTHDHQEMDEPEIIDVEEDFNPDGNDHNGRTLASYSNMRPYGYYGLLSGSSSFKSYVQNDLIPPILDYVKGALKIKYPVTGSLKVSSGSVCGRTTPSVLKNGVNADWFFMVETDSSSSYVASTVSCNLASGTKRPLVGKTVISSQYVKATTDVLLHEKQMICIMHEVVHALGFSKSLYKNWLTSSGKTLSGHITSAVLNGATTTVINAEPLTSRLRKHFGCSSLKGAYMENSGSSGTMGSHFERRQFAFEGMTSGLINQMQFSEFTLALLESTGWYVPDYEGYADPFEWGKGQGCSFLTGSCSSSSFSEFCSSSARSCVATGRGGGSCSTDSRSDNCKWVHPSENYDCDNSNADSYARLPSLQSFGRSAGSKCFTGTLNSKSAGSQTTFCFKYSCSGSGSSAQLTLNLNGKSVVCSKKGGVSVSGYGGVINCPDPVEYCNTIGKKICPRGCMGRGSCGSDGICTCNKGFKGKDCALRA